VTMPRGLTIPNSMRETVVRMSADLSPEDICTYMDVSERQQSRILKMWRETGVSIPPPDSSVRRGRPRNLSAEEVFVSAYLPFEAKKLIRSLTLWSSFSTVLLTIPATYTWTSSRKAWKLCVEHERHYLPFGGH
jgi:hypothetical protein